MDLEVPGKIMKFFLSLMSRSRVMTLLYSCISLAYYLHIIVRTDLIKIREFYHLRGEIYIWITEHLKYNSNKRIQVYGTLYNYILMDSEVPWKIMNVLGYEWRSLSISGPWAYLHTISMLSAHVFTTCSRKFSS